MTCKKKDLISLNFTENGVTCPRVSEKSMYNVVNILAPQFLIGSSSFLQVTETIIKYQLN